MVDAVSGATRGPGGAFLEVRHVSVRYAGGAGADVVALDDISFSVAEGEFAVIVGPSGCGKSTLLRLIAGLQEQAIGQALLDGAPISGPSRERGMVFQSYTLFPWLNVLDNVAFGLSLRGLPKAECRRRAAVFVEQVGLAKFEKAWPSQLSGGMRQRAALARTLANDPKILLMDEPFGALDSQTRLLMQELLLGVWERSRKTALFITHDIDEAIFLADRVLMMTARPGRIKREIVIPIPRPRGTETSTSPEFTAIKREVQAMMREEAHRADPAAAP